VVAIGIIAGGLLIAVVALAVLLRSITKPEPAIHEQPTIDRFFR